MKIVINRKKNQYTPAAPTSSPRDNRIGMWGTVLESYSEDITADVMLENGVYLTRIPVASKEWVIIDEEREKETTGERNLPPKNARVFIFMPNHTYSDCFIAPFSGFITIDQNASEPFMKEDIVNIKERITPSGWHTTDDYITGSHKIVSPDGKTSLEIDYGNKDEEKENPEFKLSLFGELKIDHIQEDSCTIKVFDTEIVIKEGEVSIKPKSTTIEVDGDLSLKVSGCIKMAGQVVPAGNTASNGEVSEPGPFNCLTHCLSTSAVHCGSIIEGAY